MRVSEVHAAESVAYLNRALVRLQDIWEEIGIPEEQRLQRTIDVHKHIKGLLDLMIVEEEELKTRLIKSIDACRQELFSLCSELQLPPFKEEDGCTMLQMEKNSRTRLEVMKEHKKQRMDELKGLIGKDRELCDIMCTTPFCIDHGAIPSLKQLESYQAYLNDLSKEKEHRHEEFVSIKKDIIVCMDDLEQTPETSFEMDVMCEDEEAFCLSNDNIAALNMLLTQLKERRAQAELRCSALRTKIQELWERLQVPQEEREELSEHMLKSRKRNIEALQAEVQRLEVLKMQSMKSVIKSIRAEIAHYWERCFYSQEQQQMFVAYHEEDFTEDLLNLHEAEVQILKKYYEDHSKLFEGVTKWQENWTLYMELDKKANDPARFNNRGGNLLKEEKQRSDLHKSLPKVRKYKNRTAIDRCFCLQRSCLAKKNNELKLYKWRKNSRDGWCITSLCQQLEKSLKAQIDEWGQEHGREFLVNGQDFLEYVQQQWAQHLEEKEKEKLERQLKKTKQTQEDMLYGTSVRTPTKRRVPGTPTPGKVKKLRGMSTMSTPSSFLSSGLGGTMCHPSIQKPPLSASKGLGLQTPGNGKTPRALDRNKENISHLRNTPSVPLRSQDTQDHNFTTIPGSYTEFAKDLSKASKSNVKLELSSTQLSNEGSRRCVTTGIHPAQR